MNRVVDTYRSAEHDRQELWMLYHQWYENPRGAELLRKHRRLNKPTSKEVKLAFYQEIRRKTVLVNLSLRRIKDHQRFNLFSFIFWKKTGVDAEFARRRICLYLK
jgi:hypothetical protein